MGSGAKGNGKENAFRLVGKYSFLSSLLVSLTDEGSSVFLGKDFLIILISVSLLDP